MRIFNVIKNQMGFITKFDDSKSKFLALANAFLFTFIINYLKAKRVMRPLVKKEFKVKVNFQGMKFFLRFPSADFSALNETCHKGIYDRSKIPRGVIFDLGAHVGTFTVKHALKKENKIFSFEPAPPNFKLLEENVKLNKLKNVTLFDHAVSDYLGTSKLYLSDMSSVNPALDGKGNNYVNVKVFTLDFVVNKLKINRVDFLKIDVERSEIDLLKGGKKTLKKFHPVIAIETKDFENIIHFLKPLGYKHFTFGRSYSSGNLNMMYCR